jgi:SAM-dependent methyltransferase
MKTRESGMPEEGVWTRFFDPPSMLRRLGLSGACRDVVDFGCGYGTFSIPAAQIVSGIVHALDIDAAMVAATEARAAEAGLDNVRAAVRDFVAEGTGLADACVDFAMLFNILHAECPEVLLREAHRVLCPDGLLAVVHWNYDLATPRGPSMDIRPRAEQCRDWAVGAGFRLSSPGIVPLPPYHYGMTLQRV